MKIISIALIGVAGLFSSVPAHPAIIAFKKMPVTVAAGEYEIVNQVIDVPPGAMIPNHYNGGPAVVSVISGRLTIKDATGTHLLATGQSTTEPAGYRHFAANRGTSVARLAVSYLIPRGAALNTFVR